MAAKQRFLSKEEKAFIKTVWAHFDASGRHDLPWRQTTDPYKIVVSELMLQQTQVSRVLPKYAEFLKRFPTARRLAAAPLGEVLKAWQGLGYNRRAKFLWLAAQAVTVEHKGKWPHTFEGLKALPGIGAYTAAAVMSFAYNEPVPLIETNVRTVYIHHFFHDREGVTDKELLPFIERTLDRERPREWHAALMDYGAHLKVTIGNINTKSAAYKKQTPFKESDRYVRGAILRALASGPQTEAMLLRSLFPLESERIAPQLAALQKEGMVRFKNRVYQLP